MTKPVGTLIKNIAYKILDQKEGYYIARLASNWRFLMPENYALHCFPSKIMFKNNQRTLIVHVYSASLIVELHYIRSKILNDIHLYFGKPVFTEIKFVQTVTPPHKAHRPSFQKGKSTVRNISIPIADKELLDSIESTPIKEQLASLRTYLPE